MNELETVAALIKAFGDPEPKPHSIEHKIAMFIDILNSPSTSAMLKKIGNELIEHSTLATSPNEKNSYLLLGYAFLGCAASQATAEKAAIARRG